MSSIIKNRYLNYEPEDVVKVTVGKTLTSGANALAEPSGEVDFASKLDGILASINEAQIELETLERQKEQMINDAKSQAEAIRNEALAEGSEIGYNEGKEKCEAEFSQMKANFENEMKLEREKFNREKKEWGKEFISNVGAIIPDALGKLFEHEVKTDSNVLDAIILKGLMSLSDEKDIRVILSEDDYKNFDRDSFLLKIKDSGYDKEVAITYDKTLNLGDCLIDTNAGFISCGINDFANSLALLIEKNISF
ncbi:MAG: hypothetical protein MJ246_04110 [Clostridia bacterium]|nr:hypothetical protein [Clostridia bacterium]